MIIGILRGAITAALAVTVIGCLLLVLFARTQDPVIVAGASMEPSLPRGSLIHPRPVDSGQLRRGDIVTVRALNGVLLTHRISRVLDLGEGRFLELRGDANSDADPGLVPATSVVGRVDWHLPLAGYLLGLVSMPVGMLSVLALLAAVVCGLWLLDDIEIRANTRVDRGSNRATTG